LQEIWYHFCYNQNNKRYIGWQVFLNEQETTYVLEKAVKKLDEMDSFLKERGYSHFIFITPSKNQVVKGESKDMLIYDLILQYEIKPYYIADLIANYNLSDQDKEDLFYK